ncbi:MAG: polysaccharide biosynthesis/export family protein, partial [Flavobacteriaceae bacterium]|nr:polysaccharide biosynthesis/export family protein [Flavobacteriaceae bacterium]
MPKRSILFFVSFILLFSSCIPNKDLVYFQGDPILKNTVNKILNDPYKLQVNDILDIRLKANDEKLVALFNQSLNQNTSSVGQLNEANLYFNSYSIDKNGNIRLPYIGDLNVLGYTEKEVREKIEEGLAKFFVDMSNIFVTVKLGGIRFTVLGEVTSPGTLVLFQNQVNIIEAIANAGDITITG